MDDLKELRKELSDTRNLMIKTDNLIMGLAAEMKQIQKKQESYERKYIFNSVVAYVLFVLIIGTLSYLGFEQKFNYMKKERDEIEKKLKETREELDSLNLKIEKKGRVEREALEIYRALDAGKKEEALRGLSKLNIDDLSPFGQKTLKDKIAGLKTELVLYAIEKATELLKMEDAKSALAELDRGREFADRPELSNQVVILTAQAQYRLKDTDKAIEILEELLSKQGKGPRIDQAVWNLASLYEAKGDRGNARKYYTMLAENFRESQLTRIARYRLRQMDKAKKAQAQ